MSGQRVAVCMACGRRKDLGPSTSGREELSHGYCSAQYGDDPEQAARCQAIMRQQFGVNEAPLGPICSICRRRGCGQRHECE